MSRSGRSCWIADTHTRHIRAERREWRACKAEQQRSDVQTPNSEEVLFAYKRTWNTAYVTTTR